MAGLRHRSDRMRFIIPDEVTTIWATNEDALMTETATGSYNFATDSYYIEANTPWIQVGIRPLKNRRAFLGRAPESDDPQKAIICLNLIKKGLKPNEKKQYKEMAEKIFEEALKYEKVGQKAVVADLEKLLTKNLKLAAIQVSKYNKIVTEEQIDEYRNALPSNRQLVIDDLAEFEKPIPKSVTKKVNAAKELQVFDSFRVFWIREVKDPIIFGIVNEEPDKYFFVDEWDDDISVEDLLKY